MLDAVDDDRAARIVGQSHDPLDAQESWDRARRATIEKYVERGRWQRRLVTDAEGANAGIVPVDIVFFVFVLPAIAVNGAHGAPAAKASAFSHRRTSGIFRSAS